MSNYKQDMPPQGGYSPITYKRVPLKPGIPGIAKLGLVILSSFTGGYFFLRAKDRMNNDAIEFRCSRLALRPMLEAEVDRLFLKQLRRNRDAEERIMKDVEGWEVGKWKGSPVYLTLDPDEYFRPNIHEYYAHTPMYWFQMAYNVEAEN